MRYKQSDKERVRQLRIQGYSLNDISKATKIPKTTIRLWITDITLSKSQQDSLRLRVLSALQEGRKKSQQYKKALRNEKEKRLRQKGQDDIGILSAREFFIAGIALYWAEGFKNKYEYRLGVCNSDLKMIEFYIKWLQALGIKKVDIVARLTISEAYKDNVEEIERYWSHNLNLPLNQFTKPFYQKSVWKKLYTNNNYYGVLRIHVKNSYKQLLIMQGWMQGLKLNV